MMSKDTLIINSTIEEVPMVYSWVETRLDSGISSKVRNKVLLISQEIVTNAIIHGNKLDASKKVVIDFQSNDEKIIITMKDEGEGYPPLPTKEEAAELDYLSEGGRGLKLAVLSCTEIEINKNLIKLVFEI